MGIVQNDILHQYNVSGPRTHQSPTSVLYEESPPLMQSNTLPDFPSPLKLAYSSPLQDASHKRCISHAYDDSNAKTARGPFRPRNANKGTNSYQLRQYAEATLGSGSLRKAVKLPEGEDLNEWLAVNGMQSFWTLITPKAERTKLTFPGLT
ncbi:MAG: Mitotic exit network component [Geoglossum umbratile]|nr:MAG: Mitotic exit network component [Geoglossum umbratile]